MAKKFELEDEGIFDIQLETLEQHWLDQPKLMMQHMKEVAECRLQLEDAEANIKVLMADLDRDIRNDPDEYDLLKVTEVTVKNAVLAQPPYRAALKKIAGLKYKLNILNAAVEALQQRKRALESLVDLHGQGYFSIPTSNRKSKRSAVKPRNTDS